MADFFNAGNYYRKRINVDDADEVWHWAVRLNVTTEKLLGAIARVGNWSDDVQIELNNDTTLQRRDGRY